MIHSRLRFALAVLAGCLQSAAIAEEGVPRATLARDFFEAYKEDVSVSGAVVVGVASVDALAGKVTQSLAVMPRPMREERELCLTILSRDGAYYSRNVFTLPDASEDSAVWLPYDRTTKRDLLESYGDTEIAITAAPGDCEGAGGDYYVVDAIRSGNAPAAAAGARTPKAIRVYINSFGATDVFYQSDEKSASVPCNFIDEGRRTSFDYWCDVPWVEVGKSGTLTILRERFGRELPPVDLTLLTGSGS